jgi:hypothetical protein
VAREQRHIAAAGALVDGRWREAARRLEDLILEYPRDALALQVGHQLDLFLGDSRMLRDRIARALPAWDAGVPGWHAVAHVHEMRHRPRDGIAWLQPNSERWAPGSFLGCHNGWHLALYYLELDDHAEVLRLYDAAIGGTGSTAALDMVDASAMLWRLMLRGVDLGTRWQPLAERWAPPAESGWYGFNDLHAMMAFVGAGDALAQQQLLDAQRRVQNEDRDNTMFTRDVGLPTARAMQAFGQGDYAQAAALLRGIRGVAHRFGGSHAQRDLTAGGGAAQWPPRAGHRPGGGAPGAAPGQSAGAEGTAARAVAARGLSAPGSARSRH